MIYYFYSNFDYLCEKNCIDKNFICEKNQINLDMLEKAKSKNTLPNMDFINQMAKYFNVSMEDLIYSDLRPKPIDRNILPIPIAISISFEEYANFILLFINVVFTVLLFLPFVKFNQGNCSFIEFVSILNFNYFGVEFSMKTAQILYYILFSCVLVEIVFNIFKLFTTSKKVQEKSLNFQFLVSIVKFVSFLLFFVVSFSFICNINRPNASNSMSFDYGAYLMIVCVLISIIINAIYFVKTTKRILNENGD